MVMRFEDLEAWQLATEVKREVLALTDRGTITKDFELRDQLRASAASAPRLISEGFGRYRPRDFARLVDMALGELNETLNSLYDAVERRHFSSEQIESVTVFIARAVMVNKRLTQYLKSCREPSPAPYRPRPRHTSRRPGEAGPSDENEEPER